MAPPAWYERYGQRIADNRLPRDQAERAAYAQMVGEDGFVLLDALEVPEVPTALQTLPRVEALRRAWKRHYDDVRHSLVHAYYQGWDLHPSQLPTRYAAVYAFFLEGLDAASRRLKSFTEKAAQATLLGDVFDDAATGQGLLNYFLRAINCVAMTETEAIERSGLTLEELRGRSFVKILANRRH